MNREAYRSEAQGSVNRQIEYGRDKNPKWPSRIFDILGYQSFLENNDAEIATSKMIDIINDVGRTVSNQLSQALRSLTQEEKDILNRIQWLVFSDTILMLMKWDKKERG